MHTATPARPATVIQTQSNTNPNPAVNQNIDITKGMTELRGIWIGSNFGGTGDCSPRARRCFSSHHSSWEDTCGSVAKL